MYYHSWPEWTWQRWQCRSTPESPNLQHYGSLTIRLFSIISRTLVMGGGGLTPLQRSNRCILQPQPTGQISDWKCSSMENRKEEVVLSRLRIGNSYQLYLFKSEDQSACNTCHVPQTVILIQTKSIIFLPIRKKNITKRKTLRSCLNTSGLIT